MIECYIEMYGAAIKLAIKEYQEFGVGERTRLKKIIQLEKKRGRMKLNEIQLRERLTRHQRWFETAREYLFNSNWLENQLFEFGLADAIEIDYIRKVARGELCQEI